MRTFVMYRRDVARHEKHDENQMNPEDVPQFEGVEFSDGRVAVRWLTAKRSTATWDSMEDMLAIHGHPEYGSELVWLSHQGEPTDPNEDALVSAVYGPDWKRVNRCTCRRTPGGLEPTTAICPLHGTSGASYA